jgi:hypothetical protein
MDVILSWIIYNWDRFSIWVTNQPLFVEVAFGIGLFYVVFQTLKLLYNVLVFLFSPLLVRPSRKKKQKDRRPMPRKRSATPSDDDSPPFVFR